MKMLAYSGGSRGLKSIPCWWGGLAMLWITQYRSTVQSHSALCANFSYQQRKKVRKTHGFLCVKDVQLPLEHLIGWSWLSLPLVAFLWLTGSSSKRGCRQRWGLKAIHFYSYCHVFRHSPFYKVSHKFESK